MQTIKEIEINLLKGADLIDRQIGRYMPYTYLVSEDLDKWSQSHDGGSTGQWQPISLSALMRYLKVPAVCPLLQWLSSFSANLLYISMIDINKLLLISLEVRCGVIM